MASHLYRQCISAERMIQVIAKYKPLFYMANPYHVQALSTLASAGEDVSSLFCIMPSGGQCTQSCVQKLHNLFPGLKMVFHFYGSTEVTPPPPTVKIISTPNSRWVASPGPSTCPPAAWEC